MTDKKALIEERVNTGVAGAMVPRRQIRRSAQGSSLWHAVAWREARVVARMKPVRSNASKISAHTVVLRCRMARSMTATSGAAITAVIVDGEGVVQRVPAMPECALEGRKALNHFHVTEAHDAVFAYVPSVDRPEPPELTLPKEFGSDEWAGFLCTSIWECNYRYALDNLADPMHGCYLHAESFTLAYGSKQDLLELNKTEDGFRVSRIGQTGANFDWTEFEVHPGAMFCFLDIPYPPAAGPGGVFRIIGFVTPMGPLKTKVFFWRMRQVEGFDRESWRFLYRAKMEKTHWDVLEQDRVMLEGMPDDARKRENALPARSGCQPTASDPDACGQTAGRSRTQGRCGMILQDRHILVTGAARGLGAEIASKLAGGRGQSHPRRSSGRGRAGNCCAAWEPNSWLLIWPTRLPSLDLAEKARCTVRRQTPMGW